MYTKCRSRGAVSQQQQACWASWRSGAATTQPVRVLGMLLVHGVILLCGCRCSCPWMSADLAKWLSILSVQMEFVHDNHRHRHLELEDACGRTRQPRARRRNILQRRCAAQRSWPSASAPQSGHCTAGWKQGSFFPENRSHSMPLWSCRKTCQGA